MELLNVLLKGLGLLKDVVIIINYLKLITYVGQFLSSLSHELKYKYVFALSIK